MAKRYGNYIGGAWKDAAAGRTFDNRNPADTSDLIGSFADSGTVDVEPCPCRKETIDELERSVLLMYTNQKRDADTILQKQSDGTKDKFAVLKAMRDLAGEMRHTIGGKGNLDEFARLLHEGWELKRSLGFGISDDRIDYRFTIDAPTIFTKPWTVSTPMQKIKEPIYEYACHEGNYSFRGILRGARRLEAETAAGKFPPSK